MFPPPPADRLLVTLQRLLALAGLEVLPTLTEAATLLSDTLDAEKIDIFLFQPDSNSLIAMGASQTPLARRQRAIGMDRLPLVNAGREVGVFQTGTPYATGQADADSQMLVGMTQGLGVRSLLVVPLNIAAERRGVLAVVSTQLHRYSEADLPFLSAVSYWIGVILHRATLSEQLAREAYERGRQIATAELLAVSAQNLQQELTALQHNFTAPDAVHPVAKEDALAHIVTVQGTLEQLAVVGTLETTLQTRHQQAVDVGDVIRQVAATWVPALTPLHVEVEQDLLIQTDAHHLRLAIESQLHYARSHAVPHTPIEVRVTSEREEEQDWVLISVQDTGPPMSASVWATVTEQLDLGNGITVLGVSMWIASRIALALGGSCRIDAPGTTGFTSLLRLPIAPTGEQVALPSSGEGERIRLDRDARRSDLTDAQWANLADLLPQGKTRGRPQSDLRRLINGILYIQRTGRAWRKLPARYGNYVTCWRHYIRWEGDGTWQRLQARIVEQQQLFPET